ncbi:Hypothetical predicted protein [Paramuricea clavata]|uniref:Uncharacterized protein n=1 Tax=Paramuricea clavata TaxID=317549 RepID=A0A6S7H0V4_PARCT|nr:Hypothetical predicted protein [Paramuricea clavata]
MSPDPQTQSMFKLCQRNILGEVKVHKQKKVPKPRSQKEHKPASPVTCCQITCQSPRWSQPVHKLIHAVNMVMDKDENTNRDESGKASEESFDEESCTEDYSMTSGEESEMEGCPEKDKEQDETIILTSEKSVKDQLKFIVCEESIATTFRVCLKCGSRFSVLVTSIIGSYCKILISCSSSAQHNISWSTGPLMNRLPAFNLLMAASILSTGMESNKIMRFMESLNILCFKRRELSNIQSAYVIPAVISAWKMEQHKL